MNDDMRRWRVISHRVRIRDRALQPGDVFTDADATGVVVDYLWTAGHVEPAPAPKPVRKKKGDG